jgi:4-amino-4-deoxy-L-arabinose transferase-like glycosyltransferase
MLNYAVFGNGADPAGYHWVNLTLHAVNVLLVYFLAISVLGSPAPAFAVAALWGVHPLLTESVTNIVGRADLLAAFGVMAGLLCYIKSASAAGRNKLLWLTALAAAQAIGLFSKENAAILPGILFLYDLTWPTGRWRERALAYAALVRVFPYARYIGDAYSHQRQSPVELRFLDGAAHRHQSNWQVSLAVLVAGSPVRGLLF